MREPKKDKTHKGWENKPNPASRAGGGPKGNQKTKDKTQSINTNNTNQQPDRP